MTTVSYYLPKHRFLADRTGYYGNRYNTNGYGILWFFVRMLWCNPPLTLKKCGGCYQSFYIRHGLICSHRGLIISHHNQVHDEILYLNQQDFPSNCVPGEPLIHQGHSRSEEEVRQGRNGLETWCDVLIWGLWESQTDAIINVIFGDSNATPTA